MVDRQIRGRGVSAPAVLEAMEEVPRDRFVPPEVVEFAYHDGPLPIGEGQTISQPYMVALMAEAAEVGPEDRVLEVGTGSGYGAAVPPPLVEQLAPGGRLIVPAGATQAGQELLRIRRSGDGESIDREALMDVRFVPLIGTSGWNGDRRGERSNPGPS